VRGVVQRLVRDAEGMFEPSESHSSRGRRNSSFEV